MNFIQKREKWRLFYQLSDKEREFEMILYYITSTKNSRGNGFVIARWKDSLLERNLFGTSTNCRVSLPLLVDVEHDLVQVIP
jgi:hypothetical protein